MPKTSSSGGFPGLLGSDFRLEQGGGDHLLLIVDEKRAFRFPRLDELGLNLESADLRLLGQRILIAIPDYDIVDPNGCFASYSLIPGVSLTPATFSALQTDRAQDLIGDPVRLLTTLHGLAFREVKPPKPGPEYGRRASSRTGCSSTAACSDKSRAHARGSDRELPPALSRRSGSSEIVLHGDLVGDHLLVDEHSGRLSGVVDFSDVTLGDPAHDLLGFWACGAGAAAYAVTVYGESLRTRRCSPARATASSATGSIACSR